MTARIQKLTNKNRDLLFDRNSVMRFNLTLTVTLKTNHKLLRFTL